MNYTIVITREFSDVEVEVKVTHFHVHQGNPSTWDSDWDYYGYTELEYDVISVTEYFEDEERVLSEDDILDAEHEEIEQYVTEQIMSEVN